MIRPLKTAFILGLFLAASLPSFALKRTDLLPADAMMDMRISDTTSFWDKLKKSPIGRLWVDPQFQTFLGNPDKDVWNELLFDSEKTAENEMMMEQFKMLGGEVVVAVSQDGEDPYLIVAINDEDFQRSLVLDDKMAEISEEPFKILKSSFQDIEIFQHINAAGTESESSSWQAHLNNTLIMGPSREWVEKSIVQLKKEAIEEPTGNPELNVNLPLSGLIKQALQEAQDEGTSAVNMQALFESFGFMGLEKFSGRIELKDDEMVVDNKLTATSLDKGIFTMLDMEPAELPTVSFIPENISLLEVGRLNLHRFWQEIPVVLATTMPQAKAQFDMTLGIIRQQIGVDLDQDLLANMGTKYLGFSTFNNDMMNTVLAFELKDSQAFKRGLETIMNAPAVQPQLAMALDTIDFLDHTLYVTKNTEPSESISFSVAGNYLLYGRPEGVRQVIRSQSSEAAANPHFEQTALVQGLRKHTPPNAFGYSVVDWKKNMAFLVHELTKPQVSQVILQKWATSGAPIPPPDLSKLPPTDHLASFFDLSYQYIEKTNHGLHQQITIKY